MTAIRITEWFHVLSVTSSMFTALYENGDIKTYIKKANADFVNTEGTEIIPNAELEVGYKYRAHLFRDTAMNFQRAHPEGYKPRLRIGQKYRFVNEVGEVHPFTYTNAVKHLNRNYWRLLQ